MPERKKKEVVKLELTYAINAKSTSTYAIKPSLYIRTTDDDDEPITTDDDEPVDANK